MKNKAMRKFTLSAATATLVASAVAPLGAAAASFKDVGPQYKEAVDFVTSKGVSGFSKTEFGVDKEITRVDAAVMLVSVLGLDIEKAPNSGFNDVPTRGVKYVNALKAANITQGKTETKFDSYSPITRGELAIWIQKGFSLKSSSTNNAFTDVNPNYKEAVNALVANKVTSGVTETLFGTDRHAKRGDYAKFLYKSHEAAQDSYSLSLTTESKEWIANGTDQGDITLQIINEKTGKVDTAINDVTVELSTTFGTLSSSKVTIKEGVAKVSLKAGNSYQAETAKINAKVTAAPDAYKSLVDKVVGSQDIAFKGKGHGDNFLLSLMHTNDTHAHLDQVAKRVTAVKEVRSKAPSAVLIDAGDVFSGTLYFNEFRGQADLQFMNLMKYDMMTMGNHEFDLGSSPEGHKALANFVKGASFPIISSNVNYSQDENLKGLYSDEITAEPKGGQIFNGLVKTINGQKVGFFGLTTEETKDISSPVKVTFSNYIKEAKEAVEAFEKLGVNKVVAVTHIGYDDNPAYDNDLTLAAEVDGLDVIVGGHSHTELKQPVVVEKDSKGNKKDPTIIVQAFQYNEFLGTVDVEFDKDGKIVGQAGKLIKIAEQKEDKEAAELLKKYSSKIEELKNTPTGATAIKALDNPRIKDDPNAPSVRKNETELGNLITDGMLDKAKEYNKDTVIAMQNGGGIRSDIDKGEITLGEVLTVLPFGNTLATMKLKGSEIVEALEHSVSTYPRENGGFLHVSGMKFTFDSSKPAGSRVQKVEVKGTDGTFKELDANAEYVIATNAFTAKGGDGYDVFKKAYDAGRVTDLGLADWENLRDYVSKLKNVGPVIEDRIKDVK
ncbi:MULTISPECIES: 5'-nucleotidase C-terminal domain-containing protein [Bacillus]|uniref:5'-nucleotidase C-terminal domain-containing protein n=1 Tax=Bacillus TaxID=1386 RepID=UPI0002DD1C27|nr:MULTISPECIES: 5'-nucleotidase C-terminal domain-containing protein [Bacillus]